MSGQNAFDLKNISEQAYSETSGVLDQLNLPSGVVRFIRGNKKTIQIAAATLVIAVVAGSLYKSYREQRLESAASDLSAAMLTDGEGKSGALQQVAADYSGTPSALWASVELGHEAMKNGEYSQAVEMYTAVRAKVKETNPMFGMLTYGIAQANEAAVDYSAASAAYTELKEVAGYQDEGYRGMGRVFEAQGDNAKALSVYEEYMGTFLGENTNEQLKKSVQEKITRLRLQ